MKQEFKAQRTSAGALAIAALVLCAAFASPPVPSTPQATANAFYARYLKYKVMGVPNNEMRANFADVITPALEKALARANTAEMNYAAATHNEVPPLLEGDPFSSLFEGATGYTLKGCTVNGTTARCDVAMIYKDKLQEMTTNWTDTLVLVESADLGWRVDDIVYGGEWAFGNKGQLTKVLNDVVAEAGSISQ